MLFERVIGDPSKKKWVKDSDELKTLYKHNKPAFTEVSMEIVLKIMQVANVKNSDDLMTTFL